MRTPDDDAPKVVLIAGPNGAGKSTVAPSLLTGPLAVPHFVNADVIAAGLSGLNPSGAAIQAGKVMIRRLRELAAARESFAFETTLASRVFAPWIGELRASGYQFHLCFLWLPSEELAIERVKARVTLGGHNVPEADIRRRYHAGLRNLRGLYLPIADTWKVLDSSPKSRPRVVASGRAGMRVQVHEARIWSIIQNG